MMRRQPKDRPEVYRATAGYHVVLSAWIPGGRPIPVAADLRYDSADPYAVCLSLHSAERRTVHWVFGRDLLVEGISRRAGIGDVVVEPIPARRPVPARRVDYVRITLRSATGPLYAQLPARAVLSFVQQTQAMVRLGAEDHHLDLDGLVRRLTETG